MELKTISSIFKYRKMKKIIAIAFLLVSMNALSQTEESFIGEVKLFAGNFTPKGWALCQGQTISINENQALFSILGTNYGGDRRTTFALPNSRGRVPIETTDTDTDTDNTEIKVGDKKEAAKISKGMEVETLPT
jgi:hypothetical protein